MKEALKKLSSIDTKKIDRNINSLVKLFRELERIDCGEEETTDTFEIRDILNAMTQDVEILKKEIKILQDKIPFEED